MNAVDLTIYQGVTWAYQWPITDENGAPLDLTGYTVHAQIRSQPGSTELYYDFSLGGNATVDDSSNVILKIPAPASVPFTWPVGHYDIHLVAPDGTVSLIAYGKVTLFQAVTVD